MFLEYYGLCGLQGLSEKVGVKVKKVGQSEKKLIRVKKWRYHRHVMFLIICPVAVTTCISRLYLSSFILWWPDDHLMTNQNVRYRARQESQVMADFSPATQKSDWAARLYVYCLMSNVYLCICRI